MPAQKSTAKARSATRSKRVFAGPVVAVGASAGGLEALERFFDNMPSDSGAAFVVVQHLSPDHESMMSHLLSRHTAMPVVEISPDMPLQANQVHLIPPGQILTLDKGRFQLKTKNTRVLTLPIDIFFQSLAESIGQRAIGVILSGSGSDGTRGAVAINEAGGFLLAQQPNSARFDSMPLNAIATGLVDAVLLPEEMAERITTLMQPPQDSKPSEKEKKSDSPADSVLDTLLEELTSVGQIDFSEYKEATVMRRIERRMQVRHVHHLKDYLQLLQSDSGEAVSLRRELLIGVTRFFRDTEAFTALSKLVIEPLVANSSSQDTLRVWVAGASSGEEVYSIAMLFLETFDKLGRWPQLKLFATDVNQDQIDVASAGQYPESAAAELSAERLERFMTPQDGGFVVKSELRQYVVFARHNLLTDPPFTRMDLVTCRNTLIYFKSEAQERALHRLRYALRPGGYLFLGSSESLSSEQRDFHALDSRLKLFQLGEGIADRPRLDNSSSARTHRAPALPRKSGEVARPPTSHQDAIDQSLNILAQAYAPPSILVNEAQELVHVFGDIQRYLHIREGWASLVLSRILPDNLVPVASALVFKALKEDKPIFSDRMRLVAEQDTRELIRLSARPVARANGSRYALLGFEVETLPARDNQDDANDTDVDVDAETMARVNVLEQELAATRESLQATIEELETANEELQATNEELMASNEELQSSNEELQSVNEELNTVNAESEEQIAELHRLNADLDSLAKASGVATVFLDEDLQLTRFSPDATSLFNIRRTDIGRRLEDFSHQLNYPELIKDLSQTLSTGRMREKEVPARSGEHFLVRMLPYETASQFHGVVATFVDVSAFRDAARLQAIIDALPETIAVLEVDGTIALVNASWIRFARANGDPNLKRSGVGVNYLKVLEDAVAFEQQSPSYARQKEEYSALGALKGVRGVLGGVQSHFSVRYPCHSPEQQRWYVMNVSPVQSHGYGAIISHFDITALRVKQEAQD